MPRLLAKLSAGLFRNRPSRASLLLSLAVVAAYLLGAFQPADRFLGDLNFRLSSRPASGDLVLVEIDSRSLQTLNTWPWSRAYHAALIQRLAKAGAATIAFDVDFSATSAPAGDAALIKAIAAADGQVILAAFAQPDHATGDSRMLKNLPLPMFRAQARVGLVNIFADADGRPRRYRLVEDRLPDMPVSLASLLAGSRAAQNAESNEFGIDYGIDPATIPRLSYVDVLTGRFDPAQVQGKTVLVGATAVELSDRFSVPAHGFIAGVEIQALAYESLVQGRTLRSANAAWVLLGIVLLTLCGGRRSDGPWRRTPFFAFGVVCLVLVIGFLAQSRFAVSIAVAPRC